MRKIETKCRLKEDLSDIKCLSFIINSKQCILQGKREIYEKSSQEFTIRNYKWACPSSIHGWSSAWPVIIHVKWSRVSMRPFLPTHFYTIFLIPPPTLCSLLLKNYKFLGNHFLWTSWCRGNFFSFLS